MWWLCCSVSACSPMSVAMTDSLVTVSSTLLQLNSTHASFKIDITQTLFTGGDYCVLVTPINVPGCSTNPPPPHPPWSTICHPHIFLLRMFTDADREPPISCWHPEPVKDPIPIRKVFLLGVNIIAFIMIIISTSVTYCYWPTDRFTIFTKFKQSEIEQPIISIPSPTVLVVSTEENHVEEIVCNYLATTCCTLIHFSDPLIQVGLLYFPTLLSKKLYNLENWIGFKLLPARNF